MKKDVSVLDDFLLTLNEASRLMRMNRTKFVNQYVRTNKIPLTVLEDKRKMIRRCDITNYLNEHQFHLI